MKIWDREKQSYIEEEEYQKKALDFLYHTYIGRFLLQAIFIRRWYARIVAKKQRSKRSADQIEHFIDKYQIDMSEYEGKTYASFNDFFIRQKKSYTTKAKLGELPAIADSRLSVYKISDEMLLSIKNSQYEVKDLLEDEALAEKYAGGTCLVFRLAVEDYHRYVFFDEGRICTSKEIPGVLHTVRPVSEKYKVFARNSRIWTLLDTEHFGKVIQIEVGALQVGKIRNYDYDSFQRMDEKGYFEYGGSTIILLFLKDHVAMHKDIWDQTAHKVETKVKIGEVIGKNV